MQLSPRVVYSVNLSYTQEALAMLAFSKGLRLAGHRKSIPRNCGAVSGPLSQDKEAQWLVVQELGRLRTQI
jgi:hypothetical protein